jgi:hypothetical protein
VPLKNPPLILLKNAQTLIIYYHKAVNYNCLSESRLANFQEKFPLHVSRFLLKYSEGNRTFPVKFFSPQRSSAPFSAAGRGMDWHITWVIWPVAALIVKGVSAVWKEPEDD